MWLTKSAKIIVTNIMTTGCIPQPVILYLQASLGANTMIRSFLYATLLCLFVGMTSAVSAEPIVLDDERLAQIMGRGVDIQNEPAGNMAFQFDKATAQHMIRGNGTLDVLNNGLPSAERLGRSSLGTIDISGNAQQNLRSVVNVNAANSLVQVLMNLNITIDSKVGQIMQNNRALLGR
jgi:hypothetical protein